MLSQTMYSNPNRTYISTMNFFPKTKTISQIKRENLQTRHSTYNYIDQMYRTGNSFKYNLRKPHIGSHRSHLERLENYVRSFSVNSPNQTNQYNSLIGEIDVMRSQLRDDYKNLKYQMNTEIDNLQMKFNLELGKQKIRNTKINNQMKEFKKEMVESQNLVIELKDRINSLKLRIDGKKMYNEDNLPVLQTKIEY
jgi:hypothetical protein